MISYFYWVVVAYRFKENFGYIYTNIVPVKNDDIIYVLVVL